MSLRVYPDSTTWIPVFPEASGDPLAGLTFAIRLQTHSGDNVPLGLWQDTAMTIPALNDFDPIAAWSDELSDSGQVALQSDTNKRPILLFVDGVPTVDFDGIDDVLVHTAALSAPCSVYIISKTTDPATQCAVGFDGAGMNIYTVIGGGWGMWVTGVVEGGTTNDVFKVLGSKITDFDDIDMITDGVSINRTNGAAFDTFFGPVVGAATEGSVQPMLGPICAVLGAAAPTDDALIQSYLPSIYSGILGT